MKNLFFLFLIIICFKATAQKDTTQRDTIIILNLQQAQRLIQDIQIQMSGTADIKNEEWAADLKMIFGSAHISDKPKITK